MARHVISCDVTILPRAGVFDLNSKYSLYILYTAEGIEIPGDFFLMLLYVKNGAESGAFLRRGFDLSSGTEAVM